MKNKFVLAVAVIMGLAYSCNNPAKEEENQTPVTQSDTLTQENVHEHPESDSIESNNGAKWTVVPDMMKHIRTMESDINHFAETTHTGLDEFLKLGASLQKNIDLLTSNCTMTGKAHDELHKWLLPYIDMVDKLNNSKSKDEAAKMFEEIKESYTTFNNYFE